jgi:hypothetical protein
MQTVWGEQPVEVAGESYTRKLSTITSVESGHGESTYSFSGHIRYRICDEGRRLEVDQFAARGIHLDGPDLGPIEYVNRDLWSIDLADDRRFALRAELTWRDAHNTDALMNVTLRGTLLQNHALAYISSATQGTVASGGVDESEVFMSTPAIW